MKNSIKWMLKRNLIKSKFSIINKNLLKKEPLAIKKQYF